MKNSTIKSFFKVSDGRPVLLPGKTVRTTPANMPEFLQGVQLYSACTLSAKMEGISCTGTAVVENEYCRQAAEAAKECGGICSECYAEATFHQYASTGTMAGWLENSALLPVVELAEADFPRICTPGRYNPFGELNTLTEALNVLTWARSNPGVPHMIMTKRPELIRRAFEISGRPDNLSVGYSSPQKDRNGFEALRVADPQTAAVIDFVFTVYTAQGAIDAGVTINCGARSCISCGRCWLANGAHKTKRGPVMVNEILKREKKKYEKMTGRA